MILSIIFALGWLASAIFGYKFGRHTERTERRRAQRSMFVMRSQYRQAQDWIGRN